MAEYSMKAMKNREKEIVKEICKLQEQNDKLIACLKRAYDCIDVNGCPKPFIDTGCPNGLPCIACQKKIYSSRLIGDIDDLHSWS